jgi:hypothetical protein
MFEKYTAYMICTRLTVVAVLMRICENYNTSVSFNCITPNFEEEHDVLAVSALRRAIAKVKQRWSVIGWLTKNLLSRAPPWFGRLVKPLVPAAFAVVTHQPALGLRGGLWPVLLMCNPKGRPVF